MIMFMLVDVRLGSSMMIITQRSNSSYISAQYTLNAPLFIYYLSFILKFDSRIQRQFIEHIHLVWLSTENSYLSIKRHDGFVMVLEHGPFSSFKIQAIVAIFA